MASVDEITNLVGQVIDPEINKPLSDLRMIGEVRADGSKVTVNVELPTPAYPNSERLKSLIDEQISSVLEDGQSLTVNITSRVRGKDAGGRIGLKIHNIIAVGSGKGGVGKSTVAAALACGLHSFGCKVGLMDADVYGPSIPHMLGATGQPGATEQQGGDGQKIMRMEPIDVDGLKLMSMGFFIEQGQSVVWRGTMLHKALTQFLKDTQWGELDYLIIDLPPGTGDVQLTLSQKTTLAGAVIVSTPQDVALIDARKAIDMFQKINTPVLGVIENMATYCCPECGHEAAIFGHGGAEEEAKKIGAPFLGRLALNLDVRLMSDQGTPIVAAKPDSPEALKYREMASELAAGVGAGAPQGSAYQV